jgi:acyl dehydratase
MKNIALINKIKNYYRFLRQEKFLLDEEAIVGIGLKPFNVIVTRREAANFAAAVDDGNPLYFEPDKNNRIIITHPLLPVKYSWALVESPETFSRIPLPPDFQRRLIHISEYLEFRHPLAAGEELTLKSSVVSILPHRLGCKMSIRIKYYNRGGELMLIEYTGALLTGARCKNTGKEIENIPSTGIVDNQNLIIRKTLPVDRLAPYLYDGCTDIKSPIHTEKDFAVSAGLPDIILQGTAALARGVSAIINEYLSANPAKVKKISAKFLDFVVLPNLLKLRTADSVDNKIYFDILEQSGKIAVAGYLEQYPEKSSE